MSGTQVPYCPADAPRYPSRYRDMLARLEAEARSNLEILRRNKQPLLAASGASLAMVLGLLLLLPSLAREDSAPRPCAQHSVFRGCAR